MRCTRGDLFICHWANVVKRRHDGWAEVSREHNSHCLRWRRPVAGPFVCAFSFLPLFRKYHYFTGFKTPPYSQGKKTMNTRERFLSVMNFEQADRTLYWEIGYWKDTIEQWYRPHINHHVHPAMSWEDFRVLSWPS